MEILIIRRNSVAQALKQLSSSLSKLEHKKYMVDYEELRDSIIQRFEFSIDTFWKFLKEYLEIKRQVIFDSISPRRVFRACLEAHLITDEEFLNLLDIIEDRNRTSHTYSEKIAEEILQRTPGYYNLMYTIFNSIQLP